MPRLQKTEIYYDAGGRPVKALPQIISSTARLNTTGGVIDRQEGRALRNGPVDYFSEGASMREGSGGTFTKKRYQYVGKEKDQESGLYYYGARYYAAWTCRFISVDPLAAKYPNLSGYLYAYNNPIRMNDPTGMEGEKGSEREKKKGKEEFIEDYEHGNAPIDKDSGWTFSSPNDGSNQESGQKEDNTAAEVAGNASTGTAVAEKVLEEGSKVGNHKYSIPKLERAAAKFFSKAGKILGRAANVLGALSLIFDYRSGNANTSTLITAGIAILSVGLAVAGTIAVALGAVAAAGFIAGAAAVVGVIGIASLFGFDDWIDNQFDTSDWIYDTFSF